MSILFTYKVSKAESILLQKLANCIHINIAVLSLLVFLANFATSYEII